MGSFYPIHSIISLKDQKISSKDEGPVNFFVVGSLGNVITSLVFSMLHLSLHSVSQRHQAPSVSLFLDVVCCARFQVAVGEGKIIRKKIPVTSPSPNCVLKI